nr:phosphate signaling complex protein PhoU [[Clostridium] fimetarium]
MMRNRFDKQLDQLNNELIEMGSLIEQAIAMAINALVNKDIEKAQQAIAFDDEVDRQEKEIEGLCLKLLLQQQPVAKDLRLISAALKMITDMERIGDHASDISEITISMANSPHIKKFDHIQEMAKETTVMVVNSIDAFVKKDIELANNVIQQDDVVDDLFVEIKQELIQMIKENPEYAEQATDLIMIGKYFERIGDHATNIAEWVIFSIVGKHEFNIEAEDNL